MEAAIKKKLVLLQNNKGNKKSANERALLPVEPQALKPATLLKKISQEILPNKPCPDFK